MPLPKVFVELAYDDIAVHHFCLYAPRKQKKDEKRIDKFNVLNKTKNKLRMINKRNVIG